MLVRLTLNLKRRERTSSTCMCMCVYKHMKQNYLSVVNKTYGQSAHLCVSSALLLI